VVLRAGMNAVDITGVDAVVDVVVEGFDVADVADVVDAGIVDVIVDGGDVVDAVDGNVYVIGAVLDVGIAVGMYVDVIGVVDVVVIVVTAHGILDFVGTGIHAAALVCVVSDSVDVGVNVVKVVMDSVKVITWVLLMML
jgi:hypothetical protein